MDERVGVDAFDRSGNTIELRIIGEGAIDGLGSGVHQQGAHPFAAIEQAVAHGVVETIQQLAWSLCKFGVRAA